MNCHGLQPVDKDEHKQGRALALFRACKSIAQQKLKKELLLKSGLTLKYVFHDESA